MPSRAPRQMHQPVRHRDARVRLYSSNYVEYKFCELRLTRVLGSSLPKHSHLAYKLAHLARDKWPSGRCADLPAAAIIVGSDPQGSDNIVGGGRRTPGDGRQNPERWTRLPTHAS